MNKKFAKEKLGNVLIKKLKCKEDNYKELENEFIKDIDKTCGTHLFAYVEVEKDKKIQLQCFVWYKDANSKKEVNVTYGLFQDSEATKIEILSCGSKIENMNSMFANCSKLTVLKLSNFNTVNVTDMFGMFNDCSSLKELDLSNFNTTKVTNMQAMFAHCSSLTELDLSNFNTINVTDMRNMFYNCSSLTNIKFHDKFNTNKVADMNGMFADCSELTNITFPDNFNTENVTDMSFMFYYCSSLTVLNLSKFNTVKLTTMFCMFSNCFKEKHTATLICKASTLKKIAEKKNSYLIIPIKNENKINDGLNDNQDKVYTCTVERVGSDPEITGVKEYQSQK